MISDPGLRFLLCLILICPLLFCSEPLQVDVTPPARVTDLRMTEIGTEGIINVEYGLTWPASWGSGATSHCAWGRIGHIVNPGDGISFNWSSCQEFEGFQPVSWTWLTASEPGQIQIIPHPVSDFFGIGNCDSDPLWPDAVFHAGVNTAPPGAPLGTGRASSNWNGVRSLLK